MTENFLRLFNKCLVFTAGLLATIGIVTAQPGLGGSDLQRRRFDNHTFLENKGQWDSRALFVSSQPGYNFWVTRDGFKVDFYQLERLPGAESTAIGPGESPSKGLQRTGSVINFKFVGAGASSEPWGYDATKTKFDFFVGNESQHARGISAYKEAYVKSLYPGVHHRTYFDGKQNRYDIVVEPGTDPSQVMFDILGADRVSIVDGKIVIKTSMGELKQDKPFAYQPVGNAQRKVDATFKQIGSNRIGFELGSYDSRLPLIIDPLVYGTYLGSDAIPFVSTGYETVLGIQADDGGNLFVTGETSSITFPVTDGPYGFSLSGAMDAFVIRLDGDAYDTSYVAYLGGSGSETGFAAGFHRATGDLWIAGSTTSANFPGTGGSGTALTGANDIFLAKFHVDATEAITPVSSRYYSAAGDNITNIDMVVSNQGDVFLAGRNTGLGFTSYIPAAPGGSFDGFVTKLNSSAAVQWERKVGSTANDGFGKIDVDTAGNDLVCGAFFVAGTQDTSTAGAPVFHTTAGVYPEGRAMRNGDIFVVKIDPTGTVVFASLLGGSLSESAYAIASDFENNIYVSGQTGSFDFPRNQGAYDETPQNALTVTKIKGDGTELLYSTGLRTTGPIFATALDVDGRGIAAIGGTVTWSINPAALPPPTGPAAPALPGSITVVNGLDGVYDDGDDATFSDGSPSDCPPTNDGFIIFLNSGGSDVLYADYIGESSDDYVNDVYVDAVGATWIAGYTETAICVNPPRAKTPSGIVPYITGNAFKPASSGADGFLVKMRVELPILNNVTLTPLTVPGGLGATSIATITLRDPAPTGGVNLTVRLSNAVATSFSPSPGTITQALFIPAGAQTVQTTVYTFPVTSQTVSDVRAILDNDFIERRLTIKPWLDDFSISPATIVGGNQLTARVTLSAAAIQDTIVSISTNRPDLVTLPSPAEIVVPAGATTVTAFLPTVGVTVSENVIVSASLLGVTKNAPATLVPAKLISFSFNPPRVNGGSTTVATVTLDGKTGADRNVTIAHVAGVTGSTIGGLALPQVITVPAQQSSVDFTVTAPPVTSSTFETMSATDGTTSVNGTLFIDDIDIAELIITPALDVISGTVLNCQVKLTRAAGSGGFVVDMSSSNPAAGTLSLSQVTIPAGSLLSPVFTFTCSVVPADETTIITASKAGFASVSQTVIVRAMTMTLSLNPTTVVGGVQNSTGTITLSAAAPAGGLPVQITSSNPAFASVPPVVTVPAGLTTVDFTITTSVTQIDRFINITAIASPAVQDVETLTVLTPQVTSFVIDPSAVTGPAGATGTVTLSAPAPAGGLLVQISDNSAAASAPANVTILAGQTSRTFNITTTAVTVDTLVTFTVTIGSDDAQATLLVRSPIVAGITFSPPKIQGGGIAIGTITLDQPAPPGGLNIDITTGSPELADFVAGISEQSVITINIPAGVRTGTFTVFTNRVNRLLAVQFTGGPSGGSAFASGFLYLKP
jgi:hypothetical protein